MSRSEQYSRESKRATSTRAERAAECCQRRSSPGDAMPRSGAAHNELITDSACVPLPTFPYRLVNLEGTRASQKPPIHSCMYPCPRWHHTHPLSTLSLLGMPLAETHIAHSGLDAPGPTPFQLSLLGPGAARPHCTGRYENLLAPASGPTPFQNSAFWVQTRAKHIFHSSLGPRLNPPFQLSLLGSGAGTPIPPIE